MQGNEVKPQKGCGNFQHRDKEKSCTIMSRVQGKEVKPQPGCNNFQHRDKEKSFNSKFRVQGKGVKPQEGGNNLEDRDKDKSSTSNPGCRRRRSSYRRAVTTSSTGTGRTVSA